MELLIASLLLLLFLDLIPRQAWMLDVLLGVALLIALSWAIA